MKSKYFVCCFVVLIVSCSIAGCKKPETSNLTETYHSSELVHGENGIDVVFQSVTAAPYIKIPTNIENVRQFPFSYLNKEGNPMKIVKITRDGNTLDLIIDKPNNKTAFIIEKPENVEDIPETSNATYMVDRYTGVLSPTDETLQLCMADFSLTNMNSKKILLTDVKMFFKDSSGKIYNFDVFLSDSLMTCEYPEYLKKKETNSLRYLGLIPLNVEEIFIEIDGINFHSPIIISKD
ncbi:MAG: hypothetical protein KAH01_01105 [Caldisericia bacterium]|nr:hypothetical protein [Caldisericia bacterium]